MLSVQCPGEASAERCPGVSRSAAAAAKSLQLCPTLLPHEL